MLESYKNLNETEKIKYLESLHGYDLSQIYNLLDESEQDEFFELLSSESKAELLTYIEPSEAGEILEELEHKEVGEIISLMEPDDITDIALEVDDELVDEWIQHLDEETKEDIETLREYSEDEAGAWMSTNIIMIRPWMDVKDAMKILVDEAPDVETIQTLFVVDKNEIFLGIVPLKTLIKAKSPLSIENLYIASTFVFDHDDIDDVTMIIQEEGIYQMPVLNENHELLGMITVDDAIDIYEEEAIADVQKLTGLFGLLDSSLLKSAFSRLPWLLLLLILSLPIAVVMSGYEHIISKYTILIVFQPLILAVAGNFGTQSFSTSLLVINLDVDNPYRRHIKEELISSIYIGLAAGAVGFVITFLFILINPNLNQSPLVFASVIGVTLLLTMIDYLYVVDKKNKLLGVLPLKTLIIARAPRKIKNLMLTKYRFLKEDTPLYQAIDMIQHYDLEMIPIVDKQGILKGIFTAEDALDLLKEETLEQYRNLAAITEESIDTKAHKKAKSRFPWLVVLMVLSIFTSTTVALFEKTISAVVVLAYFQTMILAMAGNVSTQSLASTVIKSTKDPKSKLAPHLFKEIAIGFINSLMCALAGFLVTYAFLYILKYDNTKILSVSFVVSLSLFISLGIGTLTGAFIPALLKKLNVNPSVASGPFMTTVNDMLSLLVYLGLATIMLL